MPIIKKLPQHIVDKIAAGEVVDRPASVVKELLDNALDAGATQIDIIVDKTGLGKVGVRDNGVGMDAADLQVCFLPHTTSKIASDDDLLHITSMGFRGEALNSIAAVSHVTITSRPAGEAAGKRVVISDSMLQEYMPAAAPQGTEVSVENLFASVPVRKKFISAPRTEWQQIVRVVSCAALAYPAVRFTLTHNGRQVCQFLPEDDQAARVAQFVGASLFDALRPCTAAHASVQLTGFLGTPEAARARPQQYTFVNGRAVKNPEIARAVRRAVGGLLPAKLALPFIFFLSIPAEDVDVNIHPRKEDVRFARPADVEAVIATAVQQVLEMQATSYADGFAHGADDSTSHLAQTLRDQVTPWDMRGDDGVSEILQCNRLYLVTATENGLLLIDQHAAHERILFEQFRETFENLRAIGDVHTLEKPVQVHLALDDAEELTQSIDAFAALGFDLQKDGDAFLVRAVPVLFKDCNVATFLTEVLDHCDDEGLEKTPFVYRILATLACRRAIMAGDRLSPEERRDLVTKLFETENNLTCPHGRPAIREMSYEEIGRLFGRWDSN